ncbi:MAG: phosphoribosyl-ATP diphosphatase [Alphaproteobacteria bacterium]|nr:phosphoribosyl-ATP diphosphatase [Alphaproteobacteria bacterium]
MTALPPLGSGDRLAAVLSELSATIDARAGGDAASSYTAQLLAKGAGACAKKLGEEGLEAALAVAAEGPDAVASEAGDVLYHLLVALRSRGVSLDDVAAVLVKRQGVSGLAEKASRPK